MTEIATGAVPSLSRPKSPHRDDAFSYALICAATLCGGMVGSGKDPVPGFYSTVIPLAIVAAFVVPVVTRRFSSGDETTREPQAQAILHAVARALVVGLAVWAIMWIGWRDEASRVGPAIVGLFSGVRGYWSARKLPHVKRVTFALAAIILLAFVIVPAILRRVA